MPNGRSKTESLTRIAAEYQRRFEATTLPSSRKELGHFGTIPAIADFMAGMFSRIPQGQVQILDPGAGVGTLSAAVCQRVLDDPTPRGLVFELWESDPRIEASLRGTMQACQEVLVEAGHGMEFTVKRKDFVLENAEPSLFRAKSETRFDLVIMNPPYFKVRKNTEVARAMAHVVHGQPNIYAFFMALAADQLVEGGELVAITPRSYFNGPYFKQFRKWFFDRMTAKRIHVFESRADAFQESQVLQENVILLAEKGGSRAEVILTSSIGRGVEHVDRYVLPYSKVVEHSSGNHLVRVAMCGLEQQVVDFVDRLPHRFRDLPFGISTGPVVTYRSREFLRREPADDTAPLLWMHNVRPFTTRLSAKNGKPNHIKVSEASNRLLLPAERYVLLKRFTSKEERRRLVAGIVESKDSYSMFLGLENHLNYIYRQDAELSREEALGLAALLNSALIDRYFRTISGNTQVNAAEIRALPFPSLNVIQAIGRAVERTEDHVPTWVEYTVGEAIGVPKALVKALCEASV